MPPKPPRPPRPPSTQPKKSTLHTAQNAYRSRDSCS
jgi:hypothetical protein